MPQTIDSAVVRAWCSLSLEALGREREDIDAINVYPVADGDTGTNLYLTVESANQAVEAVFAAHGTAADVSVEDAVRAMAHGALIGARGNSGTILAQLLRGMSEVLAQGRDGAHLARALRRAAVSARQAVAHPVEGTILSVASAASAAAAGATDPVAVARTAYEGARTALEATPDQLSVLERAGVVDAGGRGLVAVLGALVEALSGQAPARPARAHRATVPVGEPCADGGPAFEVIYLLEADDGAVTRLRSRLDELGDSLVVVGGDGLWNVHVHVDDAGAAVEAGIEAGRPYRIRITHFGADSADGAAPAERAQRAVVVVLPGEGLAGLCAEAGATTVLARPGEPAASGELLDAIRRAHAREVVILPNSAALRHTAAAAAEQARAEGVRVALVPTRAAVQGLAALAVHEPDRRFDEDVVAMTAAAGATRYGELAVAEHRSFTSAGVCQAGDVLGLIDGDVAVIGDDLAKTAETVLDRMLSAGGELVTLVLADDAPADLARRLEDHVRETHLAVDTVTYPGGSQISPLLIGVE
ncbi:DAK2 domain-containing protein [Streptomyces sp. SP18CS02]|uniref:DAK2 domain-containing protein n=1 Tax=Streptomyces sp. SP18CS02 TaxID=3002531 RepID=UPI002E792C79|nr:DAK2 domain-containing protein [Streptomyces sp. SP18CS02]MEE1756975.1 DAK2 domain-containing protein [Streptomyces sp. SP18CS02]